MTDRMSEECSPEEIARRQGFARKLGEQMVSVIQNDQKLTSRVTMMLWHGSLPLGKGGKAYDIDYAVFLRSTDPQELVDDAEAFAANISKHLPSVTWRDDLHYDGMKMFEAHTHWDYVRRDLPHIGAHFYRQDALHELLDDCPWRCNRRPQTSFFLLLDLWRRYCFFYRHWIYEGVSLYDPHNYYSRIKKVGFSPPPWLIVELRSVLISIFRGYASSKEGMCTVTDSKNLAFDLAALMAYAIEGIPIGRRARYKSDLKDFQHEWSRSLLMAVLGRDAMAAARAIESLPVPKE